MNTKLLSSISKSKLVVFGTAVLLMSGFFMFGNVVHVAATLVSTSTTTWYVNANATTTPDGSQTNPYPTIQAAIDSANTLSGDTIIVAAGTSTEAVTVDKAVTLKADAGADLVGSFTVATSSVNIDGFNITNPDGSFGISATDVSDLNITNNTIHNIGSDASHTSGSAQAIVIVSNTADVSSITISGNTISNIGNLNMLHAGSAGSSAKGVYLGNSGGSNTISNVTILDNTMSNIYASTVAFVSGGGGGAGAYGVLVNHKTTGLSITGNAINTLNGLWAHAIGLEGNTPNAVITGNTVTGLTDNKRGLDAMALRLESNPSATSTLTVTGNTLNGNILSLATSTVFVNSDWSTLNPGPNTYPEVLTSDGTYHYYGINAFSKIQDAINVVSNGGIINVAAGIYNEQITINKSLTLIGVGTSTEIDSPDTLETSFTTSATNKAVIFVDGATVNVSHLKIDGVGKGNANYRFMGIAYHNAAGTIDSITVTGVQETPFNGDQHGNAIYVYNEDGTARTISITNNTVSDYQKNGITANGSNLTATISGNVIIGHGATNITAQNGIQIGYGAVGSIINNTISDIYCNMSSSDDNCTLDPTTNSTASDGAAGILLYSPGPASVIVSNNTLTGNQFGIWAVGASALNIDGNSITGINGTNDTGVAVWSTDQWGATETNTTGSITNNKITKNAYGVLLKNYSGGTTFQPNMVVNNNNISGEILKGLWTNTANTIDATKNWWGTASSTEIEALISTSTVAYSPWFSDSGMTTLRYTTTNDGTSTSMVVPSDIKLAGTSGSIAITADIPSGTTITGGLIWDGVIVPPTATTTTVTISGYNTSISSAIAIGSNDSDLSFDQPVKLTFAGQTGKLIGWYNHAGTFSEITSACDSASTSTVSGAALADNGSCKFNDASDLIVWTRHFSTFVTYTATAIPVTPPVSSGGGGGGGGAAFFTIAASAGANGSISPTGLTTVTYGTYGTAYAITPNAGYKVADVLVDGVSKGSITTYTFGNITSSHTISATFSAVASTSTISTAVTPTVTATAPTGITVAPIGQVLGATAFNFTKDLKLGSQGDDVTELQNRLTQEGVYSGPITGYFGPLTVAGVKAYQAKHGISQVGTVGPMTRAQLNSSQVLGVSVVNTDALKTQIASLQAQLLVLLQQLFQSLQSKVSH
jgi:hypothetical protein